LVEDQSTPRPVDFKLPCVHHLESTPRHCMSKHAPLRHTPRVSTPTEFGQHQPLRSYVVVTDLHRLLYPSDCLIRPSRTSRLQPCSTSRHINWRLLVHDLHDVLQAAPNLVRTSLTCKPSGKTSCAISNIPTEKLLPW
jgi:hypothetical protein